MESGKTSNYSEPEIKKSKLFWQGLLIFIILAVPTVGGLIIYKAVGLIYGTAIGGIIFYTYLECTGKL